MFVARKKERGRRCIFSIMLQKRRKVLRIFGGTLAKTKKKRGGGKARVRNGMGRKKRLFNLARLGRQRAVENLGERANGQ